LSDTYDFSQNDEWNLLNAQLDSVNKKMKVIEQKMEPEVRENGFDDWNNRD
jgi:hypothetical protein